MKSRSGKRTPPVSPQGSRSAAADAGGRSGRYFTWAALVLAVLVTFGLRAIRLDVSWDIFIDEIYYLRVSRSVLNTLWVTVNGEPFYLHPPGFFFLEAGYMKLFGTSGGLIHQIYAVRYLGAALAGLTAGALLWTGRRLAGWPAGIVTAAIFALDPFSMRTNSLNMLDTPTMLWVILGYGVLFSALVRSGRQTISRRRTVAAGVLFGLALLTKEISLFVTLLPLGICFVLGWALPRSRSALAGLVAVVVYAPYWAIVYAIGDWPTFVVQKFQGFSRMAGLLQVTGFNQRGGPSFLDALVTRLDNFATTYALFATGAVAVCVLLLTGLGKVPERRLLMVWTASAYAFLAYAMVFGTLEEQFYYYLVIPSILATVVTMTLVLQKAWARSSPGYTPAARRGRLTLKAAAAACGVVLILWNMVLAYTMIFGSLADHFYYYLLANSVIAAAVVVALAIQEVRTSGAGAKRPGWLNLETGAAGFALVLISWNAFLVHAVVFGSLGDWLYYYLLVNSGLAAAAITALELRKAQWSRGGAGQTRAGWRRRTALEVAAVVFVGAVVLWNAHVWEVFHTVPDNGYQRVVSYVEKLPKGSRIAATSDTGEFLVQENTGSSYYKSVEALRKNNVGYVVISSDLATSGYNEPPPKVYRWVKSHGRLVYGFRDRSSGLLGVWRLREPRR